MVDHETRVRVSTLVATDPADAFEVFTRETALWWRRDPRFRISSAVPGTVRFEATEGARVLEELPDGESNEIGTILVWRPGERLVFEWRRLIDQVKNRFRADDESLRTVEGVTQMLQITPSDREALRLLATGHSRGDVAADLGISAREMETQLMKLFAAMGAATQTEAIANAQRRGLLG